MRTSITLTRSTLGARQPTRAPRRPLAAPARVRGAPRAPRAERVEPLGNDGKLVSVVCVCVWCVCACGDVKCGAVSGRRHAEAAASGASLRCHPFQPSHPPTSQAPVTPQTPVGQQMAYLLKMEPHLFRAALDAELSRIQAERAQRAAAASGDATTTPTPPPDTASLVLYRRMDELRRGEQALSVQDLMYASVLERFLELGVPMLPRLTDAPNEAPADLKALTEGVHSAEALDLVKDHIRGTLGPASTAFSNTILRMSRLQAAQVYAASVLFGYFLRRVDARFQLERATGLLPGEAVARLEALFAAADSAGPDADPDAPTPPPSPEAVAAAAAAARPKGGSALRSYIESFDAATMAETASVVSAEGSALVEAQVTALFGDLGALQRQMADAVGDDATSMDDLMARVQKAVADGTVESLAITAGTQRRAVLEAVAYGSFLRDVEGHIEDGYAGLLTPAKAGGDGPFGGGGGGGGDGGGGGGGGGGSRRRPAVPGPGTATM